MINQRTLYLFSLFLVLQGCTDSPSSLAVEHVHTLDAKVVYEDEPGYSTLTEVEGDSLIYLKKTYWPGFTENVDTLVWKDEIEMWYSRKFTTRYQINDSVVNWWFELKLVHPSSNWQGQTPGLKLVPYQGKRLK